MMMLCNKNVLSVVLLGALTLSAGSAFGQVSRADVDAVIRPLMSNIRYRNGRGPPRMGQHTFYNYGVAPRRQARPSPPPPRRLAP